MAKKATQGTKPLLVNLTPEERAILEQQQKAATDALDGRDDLSPSQKKISLAEIVRAAVRRLNTRPIKTRELKPLPVGFAAQPDPAAASQEATAHRQPREKAETPERPKKKPGRKASAK